MDRGTVVEAEEKNNTSSQADGSCLREDDGARDRGDFAHHTILHFNSDFAV
jgi:hypothetical protein